MSRPRDGVLAAIGNTPLVRLRNAIPTGGGEVWVKLEYANPTGSMKDRLALAMIEGAERDGLLQPGMTVVEYTGGSTGPALALVCGAKGYRLQDRHLHVLHGGAVPAHARARRRAGGAPGSASGPGRVTAEDIQRMRDRAAELAAEPGHYATDQFNTPYGVPGHRDMLGHEIWEQTDGRVDRLLSRAGYRNVGRRRR